MGRRHQGRQPVHHGHGQLAAAQQRQHAQCRKGPALHAMAHGAFEQQCARRQGQERDGPKVDGQRRGARRMLQRFDERQLRASLLFQHQHAASHQVKADVATARVIAVAVRMRQLHHHLGDVHFAARAALGDAFNGVAVAVARGEIHQAIRAGRVQAQGLLDHAHGLDKFLPIHGAEKTQAADAVGDRHLVGRLLPDLGLDLLLDGEARLGQLVRQPRQGQGQRGTLSLQAARQFGHEGAGHRRIRTGHVGYQQDQAAGIALGDVHHLVGPGIGQVALHAVVGHARSDAAQVFDQGQAQHDGHGPQFTQRERGDILVSLDEVAQVFQVDPAVAMRDDFQRNLVHARAARVHARRQSWQFLAVVLRQVAPRGADLLFDQVKIIQQPFRGGRNLASAFHRGRQLVDGGRDQGRIVGQARQQAVAAMVLAHRVAGGHVLAVGGHLHGAE